MGETGSHALRGEELVLGIVLALQAVQKGEEDIVFWMRQDVAKMKFVELAGGEFVYARLVWRRIWVGGCDGFEVAKEVWGIRETVNGGRCCSGHGG